MGTTLVFQEDDDDFACLFEECLEAGIRIRNEIRSFVVWGSVAELYVLLDCED